MAVHAALRSLENSIQQSVYSTAWDTPPFLLSGAHVEPGQLGMRLAFTAGGIFGGGEFSELIIAHKALSYKAFVNIETSRFAATLAKGGTGMHTSTYYCTIQSVYRDWFWIDIRNVNAGPKRPHRVIGRKHRYHDTTIPPLDFRSRT